MNNEGNDCEKHVTKDSGIQPIHGLLDESVDGLLDELADEVVIGERTVTGREPRWLGP